MYFKSNLLYLFARSWYRTSHESVSTFHGWFKSCLFDQNSSSYFPLLGNTNFVNKNDQNHLDSLKDKVTF